MSERGAMIVGAGLAGLGSAISLRRAGIDVTVYERTTEFRPVGGALTIWVNGMAALRELGVLERVEERGSPVLVQHFRSDSGTLLMNIPTAEIAHKHDLPPPLIVERGEVLRALYEALGEGVVAWGHEVTGYSQNGELDLEFAGAPAQSGGVAILADGLDSRLRQSAFGRTPRYAGYQSYRGIADFEHHAFPHGQWTAVFGRGTRIGVTHLGRGKIFWFAGVMGDEENAFAGDPPKEVAAAHLKKFYAPIPELVEATPESQIWHTAIRDIEPLERWTDGRVTLLGDAAHATTPNLGRGSGEALEDAVAIGKTLAGIDLDDRGAVVAALARFEARRRPLTTEVQKESWKAGEIASWTNPMKCLVRNQVMRRIVGPKAAKQVDDELEELIERGVG